MQVYKGTEGWKGLLALLKKQLAVARMATSSSGGEAKKSKLLHSCHSLPGSRRVRSGSHSRLLSSFLIRYNFILNIFIWFFDCPKFYGWVCPVLPCSFIVLILSKVCVLAVAGTR